MGHGAVWLCLQCKGNAGPCAIRFVVHPEYFFAARFENYDLYYSDYCVGKGKVSCSQMAQMYT